MAGIKKFFDKLLKKDRRDVVIKEIPTEENGTERKKTSAYSGGSAADAASVNSADGEGFGASANAANSAGELSDVGVIALPEKTDTARYYTVRAGDTLWGISQRFGSSINAIAAANGIKNPDLIYAGEVFLIP